jgi:NAD-dependent protein deacetylase/lipoamidase
MSCGARGPIAEIVARLQAGEDDPPCPVCGGILKTATISFGQSLVAADLRRAELAAATANLIVAVGTSLGVYPIAGMVPIALQNGAKLMIVNAQETPFDEYADVIIREPLGTVLPLIDAAL